MKTYPMLVTLSKETGRAKEIHKQSGKRGKMRSYTEVVKDPEGFRVWINSSGSELENVENFFYEMTHVALHIFNLKYSKAREESLCNRVALSVMNCVSCAAYYNQMDEKARR